MPLGLATVPGRKYDQGALLLDPLLIERIIQINVVTQQKQLQNLEIRMIGRMWRANDASLPHAFVTLSDSLIFKEDLLFPNSLIGWNVLPSFSHRFLKGGAPSVLKSVYFAPLLAEAACGLGPHGKDLSQSARLSSAAADRALFHSRH